MPGQLQLANNVRTKKAYDVGTDRELKARIQLFGNGCTAEHVSPLQHKDLSTRLGQVGSAYQPVVSAADDDGIVGSRH